MRIVLQHTSLTKLLGSKQASKMQSQSKYWCWTFNNYLDDDVRIIRELGNSDRIDYLVFGNEVAPSTGTPHLQGFTVFKTSVRGSLAQKLISRRVNVHIEKLRSTPEAASTYCKKDGSFEEFGALPQTCQGKRSDWESFITFVKDLGRRPTKREIILFNPGLYARNARAVFEVADANLPHPTLSDGELPRDGWQRRLAGLVSGGEHRDRIVEFVVDEVGNSGKSWFCRWALSNYPEIVQVLRIGKRDDLAYSVDANKSVFLFDVPRGQMQFLQYSVMEMLKDRLVFSPKYESGMKVLRTVPLVVVFCNESPDMEAMSRDRYKVTNIRQI